MMHPSRKLRELHDISEPADKSSTIESVRTGKRREE